MCKIYLDITYNMKVKQRILITNQIQKYLFEAQNIHFLALSPKVFPIVISSLLTENDIHTFILSSY